MYQLARMLIVILSLSLAGCANNLFSELFHNTSRPVTVTSLSSASTCPADSTQETAQKFYDLYIPRRGNGGLPDNALLAAMRPYLSNALYQALNQAKQYQRAQLAANPEEKPDFSQGDLLSSLFEGPDKAWVVPINKNDKTPDVVILPVNLSRQEEGHTYRWEDAVVLVKQGDCWAVDNIHYGGNWDLSTSGTLQQMLSAP